MSIAIDANEYLHSYQSFSPIMLNFSFLNI